MPQARAGGGGGSQSCWYITVQSLKVFREHAPRRGSASAFVLPEIKAVWNQGKKGADLDRLLSVLLVLVQQEENQIGVRISLPKGTWEELGGQVRAAVKEAGSLFLKETLFSANEISGGQ